MPKEIKLGPRAQRPTQPANMDAWVEGGIPEITPPTVPAPAPAAEEEKKRLTIDITPELHYRLKQEAARRRTTIKALFEEWAALHLPPES